jgi:hypothetical protein
LGTQLPVGRDDPFPAADEQGAALSGCFHRAFEDGQFGFGASPHIESVKSLFQGVERSVGSVELERLLLFEEVEAKVDRPFEEMEPDTVITLPGHVGEFHQGPAIKTEEVFPAEAELGAAVPGLQLIALDQGQVDHPFFRSKIPGSLDDNVALDVGQAGEAIAVVAVFLGKGEER